MTFIKEYLLPVFELIVLFIQIYSFFKPSKDSITINQGDRYYFNTTHNQMPLQYQTSTNNANESLGTCLALLASYIFYCFFQKDIVIIVMGLSLIKILRYRMLKISTRPEIFIPTLLSLAFYSLKALPDEMKQFWKNAGNIDKPQFTGLSQMIQTLKIPIKELVNLALTWNQDYQKNLSIFGTIFFVLFTLSYLLKGIFTPKSNIRITSRQLLLLQFILFSIIYGFIFYHIKWNPIRLFVEALIHFFSH